MRSFKGTLVIILAVVFALLLGRQFANYHANSNPSSSLREQQARPPTSSAGNSAGLPQVKQPYARTPMLGLDDPRWKEFERINKIDPEWQWKKPIQFYGIVLDDLNRPISGATVEMSWNGTEKYGPDGVGKRKLLSAANGEFFITGIEGKCLVVRVTKDGYHVPTMSNMSKFEYAGFWEPEFIEPLATAPIVFKLVKRLEAELTYRIYDRFFLEPPGLQSNFDFLDPKPQSGQVSDLHIQFTRPIEIIPGQTMDWSVSIEGQNGTEIIETKDEFMQRAPDEGYKQRLDLQYKNTGISKVRFYLRNKIRKFYAAVEFELDAHRKMNGTEPASVIVMATINPNNSPNVEYDPLKNIRKMGRR